MNEAYTKEDLVEFLRWNSNAPMRVIKKATVEELEDWIEDKGLTDKFLNDIEKNREYRRLEKQSNKMWAEIRKLEKGLK